MTLLLTTTTLGDHIENVVLLCLGLLILVVALAACESLVMTAARLLRPRPVRSRSKLSKREQHGDPVARYDARLRALAQQGSAHKPTNAARPARKRSLTAPRPAPSALDALRRSCDR